MNKVRLLIVLSAVAVASIPALSTAGRNDQPATFDLVALVPNVAKAPNGDQIAVTGTGTFSVHPKSVAASGAFVHTDKDGNVLGSGAWVATQLIAFDFWGCGVVESIGLTLPSNFCGGLLKLRVMAMPDGTSAEIPGILTVFCIVGDQAPSSHDEPSEEGINLVVPGFGSFNKIVSGMNIYIASE